MADDGDPNSEPPGLELPEEFQADDEVAALVERAQSGDADALNELFARYHQTMVQLAQKKLGARLRSKEEPVDLAQTTFREATRDFERYEYRGEGSLLRWLQTILQNKIRDRAEYYSAGKRNTAKERPLEATADDERGAFELPSDDLSVTRVVARDESFVLLHEALKELSDEHRQAIALVFFQGLPLREAGEKMGGRSEDAVRMMLRRAEAKLGDKLRRVLGDGA